MRSGFEPGTAVVMPWDEELEQRGQEYEESRELQNSGDPFLKSFYYLN